MGFKKMPVLIFSVLLVATMTAAVPLPTPDPQIEADCFERFNCTGHKGKVTCGSNGIWYQNVCILRYQRCVYNIIVQRDRDEIACMGVPVPDFTAVTPAVTPVATATAATPPSTATTPTPDPQLQAACFEKFNCTGNTGKVTCGSDGMWYQNVCTLRYLRCVYNLETLQRDREGISCMGVPVPDFTAVTPTTAPTAATPPSTATMPTPDPQLQAACFERFNCTGNTGKVTCGSDGMWYQNVCTLRYLRCVYNLETLQRDHEGISCMNVPVPDFN